MTNDEKHHHVAAAAVHGKAEIILTLNLRHFLVLTKLEQQAADRGRNLSQLLGILDATVPDFVAVVFAAT